MFERYTEKARRVIFFARYETSQLGATCIETEHLLLGLLRDQTLLARHIVDAEAAAVSIRKQIETRTTVHEKIPASVDLPLSDACKRALIHSEEEAKSLRSPSVKPEHLLLGLLRHQDDVAAQLLREQGISLELVRQKLAAEGPLF